MNAAPNRSAFPLALAVFLFFAVIAGLSLYMVVTPSPLPATAPPTEFSAVRALEYDRAVASVPHPAGSPANEKVRQYILDTLKSLGVEAEAWSPLYVRGHSVRQANAVLGRIRGTATTKAFTMETHYDSVPYGPGAADDCGGVAAMLEIARALKASPPLMNDVIFVFSDQEESGADGAKAFTEHAWFKDVGVLLGFEARGNRGPSFMFETSPKNGWLIEQLIKAKVYPIATSLMYDVYKRMPFNSDFSVFKRAGVNGMNLAFVDNFAHYHTKNDNPDNLSLRSLQHHGIYGLGLARHFGNIPLDNVTAPDAMYFNVLGPYMVHYPLRWNMPLALLTVLIFLGVLAYGFSRRHLSGRGLLGGILAFAAAALLAAATATCLLAAAWGPHRLFTLYTTNITSLPDLVPLYHNNLYGAAFAAGAVCVLTLFYGWLFTRARVQNLAAGALCWWAGALLAVAVWLPGGSYMLQWPLLFATIGLAFIFHEPEPDALCNRSVALLSICAAPGVLFLVPSYQAFLSTVMIMAGPFMVLIVVFLFGLFLPQLAVMTKPNKWWMPVPAACLAVLLIAIGLATSGYTSLRPKLNSVSYHLDLDKQEARWISSDDAPDEWTSQFFPPGTHRETVPEFGVRFPVLSASAPIAPLTGPDIKVVSDTVRDGARELVLHIESPAKAGSMNLRVTSNTRVISASLSGKPLDGGDKGWDLYFRYFPREGADLTLKVDPSTPLAFKTTEEIFGLPPGIRPRPDYMAPEPNTVKHGKAVVRGGYTHVTRTFTFPSPAPS